MSFYGFPVLFRKKDNKITLSKACTLNIFTEEKLPMFQARALAFYLEYNTSILENKFQLQPRNFTSY